MLQRRALHPDAARDPRVGLGDGLLRVQRAHRLDRGRAAPGELPLFLSPFFFPSSRVKREREKGNKKNSPFFFLSNYFDFFSPAPKKQIPILQKSYNLDEVTPEKMAWLRDGWGGGECHASTAAAAARALVVPAAALSEPTCAATAALARGRHLDLDAAVDARDPTTAADDAPFRDEASRETAALATAALLSSWSDRLLPRECPLFARKFPAEVSAKLAEVLGDCDVAAYGHEACDSTRAVEREAEARKELEKKLAEMRKKRKTTHVGGDGDRDEKPR